VAAVVRERGGREAQCRDERQDSADFPHLFFTPLESLLSLAEWIPE
jgi:hypothetical protein